MEGLSCQRRCDADWGQVEICVGRRYHRPRSGQAPRNASRRAPPWGRGASARGLLPVLDDLFAEAKSGITVVDPVPGAEFDREPGVDRETHPRPDLHSPAADPLSQQVDRQEQLDLLRSWGAVHFFADQVGDLLDPQLVLGGRVGRPAAPLPRSSPRTDRRHRRAARPRT